MPGFVGMQSPYGNPALQSNADILAQLATLDAETAALLADRRAVLIDDDGDGYTHVVSGSDVTSFAITIPTDLQGCDRFELECGIVMNTSSLIYFRAQPNGTTANSYNQAIGAYSGTTNVAFRDDGSGLLLHVSSTEATFVKANISATFYRDGNDWISETNSGGFTASVGSRMVRASGQIDGYTSDWTSLTIISSVASQIKIGSRFRLWGFT